MTSTFPPVNQIFEDLEKFRDFCRYEGKPYDEADLYNGRATVWQAYQKYQGYLRAKARRKSRPNTARSG